MAMALVPAVLTLNVSPCSFSVAVDTREDEAPLGDLQGEVLGHLVAIHDVSASTPDLGGVV